MLLYSSQELVLMMYVCRTAQHLLLHDPKQNNDNHENKHMG